MTKAVVVREFGASPEVCSVHLPDLRPRDVRIRIAAAGVCHSDLSTTNGTVTPVFPLVLGHEASGTVTAVGEQILDLEPGTPVVLNWAPACRTCWFCLHSQPWLCTAVEGVLSQPRGHLDDGTPLNVAFGVGAFAEEIVVPRSAAIALPADTPIDLAALLGCAAITGVGAVRNAADVRAGDSVLVLGLGGIGLSAIAGAKIAGAHPIIAVDIAPEKEALAKDIGATHFLLADSTTAKQARALTCGRGVDYALECVGSAATIRVAWQTVRRGGTCIIVGVGRHDDQVSFTPMELFHFSRVLTSSIFGSCDPERDLPVLADWLRNGDLDLGRMISHRVGLSGVPEAFARMGAGVGARTLIDPSTPGN